MKRSIHTTKVDKSELIANIFQGGTFAGDPEEARNNLDIVGLSDINRLDGVAGLDSSGLLSADVIPLAIKGVSADDVKVTGASATGEINSTLTFTINNFDSFKTYNVNVSSGSFTRVDDIITVTLPNFATVFFLNINSRSIALTAQKTKYPLKPSLVSKIDPVDGLLNPTITTSAFTMSSGTDTHLSSDWEVSKFSDFNTLVDSSYGDTVNKISYKPKNLEFLTVYYLRVRYRGSLTGDSSWSDPITFTTEQQRTYKDIILSANSNNYVLDPSKISGYVPGITTVRVTVNNGVVIGSSSTSSPAMQISGFTTNDRIELTNNGYIVGAGGNGGHGSGDGGGGGLGQPGNIGGNAINISSSPVFITNNGTIGGGGGGGGSGGRGFGSYYDADMQRTTNYQCCGGGGGGGAGSIIGYCAANGDGDGTWADVNGGGTVTGANGTLTTGGSGGGGGSMLPYYQIYAGAGGKGGDLGQPGSAGGIGTGGEGSQPGGAAGKAVVGNTNVTWVVSGNVLGPLA